MFFGEYEYKLDQKGRIPVPPRYRQEFRDGMVINIGEEKCLTVFTVSEWAKYAESISSGTFSPSKIRRLNRAFFGSAFQVTLDGQGRVALPASLRQYAGIQDDAVFVGVNNTFELWNKADWESEKSIAQQQRWQNTESLERR